MHVLEFLETNVLDNLEYSMHLYLHKYSAISTQNI